MAKPKLALIPAAQGTKLYSVLPSDGTGDFTFTRGSVATRINSQGLIENVASGVSRLDYPMIDGVQKGCPHHILEPARTNLILNSQKISLTPTKAGTFVDNFAISPDGTLNATKLTATDVDPYFYQNISYSAVSYTASIYIKGIGNSVGKEFQIRLGTNIYTDVIPLEWTRFKYTVTMASGVTSAGLEIPNPAVVGDEVLVWGWQVEVGSFPTSYIPTNGESGGVTRSAETASGAGNSTTFNDSEGVLMAEISALANDSTNRQMTLSDGTNDNRLVLKYDNQSNIIQSFNRISGVESAFLSASVTDITLFSKCLVKYKVNDYQLWINGFKLDTDTSASVWPTSTLNDLRINAGGGADFYGNVKQLQYFDSAIADTQLEQLTSWTSFTDMANGQLYTIE